MQKIAIFASGNGTNAENIIKYFANNSRITVSLIGSNNRSAKVLQRAAKHSIPTLVFSKEELNTDHVLKELKLKEINFIVLAGFLLQIPRKITKNFINKIINIHPSLLPLYGGKGMYGLRVHQKVFESKDTETGITIHFVNHKYDNGKIIFQAQCQIELHMTIKAIIKKVHKLEMKFFPRIIESVLNEKN